MANIFENITWFLKIFPGLVLFPFGLYFGIKKIGFCVGFQVKVTDSRVRGVHISSIIFQNHKDRPLAITEIFGIQDNVKFQIEEPKIPILLKSFETIVIKPEDYSKYVCRGKRFEVDLTAIDRLQIFVVTPEKIIPCKPIFRPAAEIEKYYNGLDVANKVIRRFNDVVYGEDSLFAIVYQNGKDEKTAIIDKYGLINESDQLSCSNIPKNNLTPDGIKAYLKIKTGIEVQAFELRHN